MASSETFWQRLLMEYPDLRDMDPRDKQVRCPASYGYEVKKRGQCQEMTCEQCWNRRMEKQAG